MFQVHDSFGVPLKYLMYCCNCATEKSVCVVLFCVDKYYEETTIY